MYVEMIKFSFLRSFLHSNIYVLAAREKGALLKATSKHSSPCLSLDSGLRWTYVEITGAKNGKKKIIEVNFETPLRPKQTINREENKNLIL